MLPRIQARRGHWFVCTALALLLVPSLLATALAAPGVRVAPSDADGPGGVMKAAPRNHAPAAGTDVQNLTTLAYFGTIQAAIDAATPGDVLEVQVASHAESLVAVNKAVTIQGWATGATITPTTNTGTAGDARGWFLVTVPGVSFKNLTFDGSGFSIYQMLRFTAAASGALVEDCDLAHATGQPLASYDGRGIATQANITVRRCTFTEMRRIGVHIFGSGVTGALVTECAYTGKGAVDGLDYGIEFGGGAVGTVSLSTITNCVGIALVDSSGSAGVLVTDYWGPGTAATLTGNFITGNSMGVGVGFLATDASVVVAHGNDLSGNAWGAPTTNSSKIVDASANWWGSNVGATIAAYSGTAVDYTPWLHLAGDTGGGAGFQGDYSVLDVDDDSPQVGTVNRVQEGVNLAVGSTVNLAAGTYEGQVVIATNGLVLQGAGVGSTTIRAPVTMTGSFTTGSGTKKPIVFVNGVTGVEVLDLTVDGFGRGNTNNQFVGVAFWNGGGKLLRAAVVNVQDTPFSGAQHGVAVYAANNTGGPYSLEVGEVTLAGFQKNGTAFTGNGLTVDMHDCSVVGAGPTGVTAQNGVQVSSGTTGGLSDVTIAGIEYTGSGWTAAGLLGISAPAVNVSGASALTGCQTGLYYQDANGSVSGCSVTGGTWAAVLYNTNATLAKAGLSRPQGTRAPVPASPYEGEEALSKSGSPSTAATLFTVSIANGCILGTDTAGSAGVYAWTAGGGLNVALSNLELEDWDEAIVADGPVAIVANNNAITSNLTAGFDNLTPFAAQNAEFNWWGSATGPSGVGGGSGDAVLGTNVDYYPWLGTGTDLNAGCGFTPAALAVNTVTPVPPSTCISTVIPCVTVPVNIARADALPMRGFSVDIQLSANLMLCSGTASITEGTYLNSISGTNFLVLDNGGGLYTVDCAILGLPCGAVAPTGNLFNLAVKNSGIDGTGTVTVASVIARDCDNAPISVIPGAPASITIDNTVPLAITGLAAAQKKTLNDADGTTKIQLTFTPPGDAAVIEIYRAGFGQYPEYDDAGGAVPATPSYPPGAPWALTGVTASGGYDEVATPRDFWYYVGFAKDACGNVSAVSNKTTGTLNYHLGDVTDGFTPGAGDNLVGTVDISLLGMHYGALLGAPPAAWSYLDVGPTTNYSVNARPTTDNKLQFEDLMMFAINYGTVSKARPAGVPAATDELIVLVPEGAEPGGTLLAHLWVRGTGQVQGLSARLQWNAAVVEPVGVEPGELVRDLDGVVFSPEPGTVDAALLGLRDQGLSGEGDLATVRFRVTGSGDPAITIAAVDARDRDNARVEMGTRSGNTDPQAGLPRVTALLANFPNPFNPSTKIPFTLGSGGQVELAIFTVDGRKIRTLVNEVRQPGLHEAVWNGTDETGSRVSSGAYYVRLVTRDGTQSRPVVMLK